MTTSDLPRADESPSTAGPIPLEMRITVNEDGPDEVTLSPHDGSGGVTRWVTAREDSVVLLDEMR